MATATQRWAPAAAEEVPVVLAVSSAVAGGSDLLETLEQIAAAAVRLSSADAAALILREGEVDGAMSVAASWGLDRAYADHLNRTNPLGLGRSPSSAAAGGDRPVTVDDVFADPRLATSSEMTIREHYGAMVAVPVRAGDAPPLGVLNAYRLAPGRWGGREVDLLSLLADHAAIAIRTAHLLEGSQRQVDGLSLMVRSLRAQAHEHANRLHAIHGLIVLGEVEAAKRLIATIEEGSHGLYGRVTRRIENATLAGFLLAESAVARERGIDLTLHPHSRLAALPPRLDDLDAVALLGNLVGNAVERAALAPRSRRRVAVRIEQEGGATTFQVRDWARGSLHGHGGDGARAGLGLALAHHVANRARGVVEVERREDGLVVAATFAA
jgi:GAF domain-containing protein